MADRSNDDEAGMDRRVLLAGVAAGAGFSGAAGWYLQARASRGPKTVDTVPPPDREVAFTPAEAGGFAGRDESFVAGAAAGTAGPAGPDGPAGPGASAAEVAAATEVPDDVFLATDDPVVHLLRRTTFGPTPDLVDEVHEVGIDAWLAAQADPDSIADDEADRVWALFPAASMGPAEIQADFDPRSWDAMAQYVKATLARQIWSRRQLFEVMVDFWANHLNVATPGGTRVWDVAPSYHNDVIRAHAMGSFSDMLLAANRHPAMLRYLTNDESHKDAVNENLGRELLELHTVGVGAGYTEEDVRNSAYILTGRGVVNDDSGPTAGTFVYRADRHWTGPVRVLDFSHDNGDADEGLEVGDAYLRHLASHPATAHAIARKLAVRFVADDPPADLVERLATQYLESDTAVVPVLDLLFRSPELWAAPGRKTRRPLENTVASVRALGIGPGDDPTGGLNRLYHWTYHAGHRPLGWRPPDGYPDVYPPWRSASSMLEMWNIHRRLARGRPEELDHPAVPGLPGTVPQGTVGEHVDRLCRRLCFQTFRPEHRDTLLMFAGAGEATPVTDIDLDDRSSEIAALILDSPYFALR